MPKRKPTVAQIKILELEGIDHTKYLVKKDTPTELVLVSKTDKHEVTAIKRVRNY